MVKSMFKFYTAIFYNICIILIFNTLNPFLNCVLAGIFSGRAYALCGEAWDAPH